MSKCIFEKELCKLINKYSQERNSNTPDFILAKYLFGCLGVYNSSIEDRDKWYGFEPNEFLFTGVDDIDTTIKDKSND